MKIYLVGGAVRDALLQRPIKEKDYVVVGSSVDEMLSQGFQPVGKSFPVFLHPQTKEEYALARTEKKIEKGYHGFTFHAAPDVTLEADLRRRDITINAMAQDPASGILYDPYGGQADLNNRIIRHVSDAFTEDPVRILRVARFAARYTDLGFHIAPETMTLMRTMVQNGEVDALVPERVWRETETALREENPAVFFAVLKECGALGILFPELDALYGIPQNPQHHPEIDCAIHTRMVLERATHLTPNPVIRFAALMHDLGKAQTPRSDWPSHPDHGQRSVSLVKTLCQRLHVPTDYEQLAVLVAAYHGDCHQLEQSDSEQCLALLEHLDAFRRPARLADFLLACQADSQGRLGFEETSYLQASILMSAYEAASNIDTAAIAAAAPPQAIKQAIREARLKAIEALTHTRNRR